MRDDTIALHGGAAAFHALLRDMATRTDQYFAGAGSGETDADEDVRDYRALAGVVAESLRRNFLHEDMKHREGYLRALTSLLSIVTDGCGPSEGWSPIRETERSFSKAD